MKFVPALCALSLTTLASAAFAARQASGTFSVSGATSAAYKPDASSVFTKFYRDSSDGSYYFMVTLRDSQGRSAGNFSVETNTNANLFGTCNLTHTLDRTKGLMTYVTGQGVTYIAWDNFAQPLASNNTQATGTGTLTWSIVGGIATISINAKLISGMPGGIMNSFNVSGSISGLQMK